MHPNLVLSAVAAALIAGPAAAQAWDVYSFPDAKFAAQFPAQPRATAGSYRTNAGLERPARIWSAQQDNVTYTLTIADFSGTALEKDTAISDAVKVFAKTGEIALDVDARINAEYGHELSVKDKDGGRSVVAIFFFDDHLYVLDGHAPPPNASAAGARLIRFQQSLQFLR